VKARPVDDSRVRLSNRRVRVSPLEYPPPSLVPPKSRFLFLLHVIRPHFTPIERRILLVSSKVTDEIRVVSRSRPHGTGLPIALAKALPDSNHKERMRTLSVALRAFHIARPSRAG